MDDFKKLLAEVLEGTLAGLKELVEDKDTSTVLKQFATSLVNVFYLHKNLRKGSEIIVRLRRGETLTKKDVRVIVALLTEATFAVTQSAYRAWDGARQSMEAAHRRQEREGSFLDQLGKLGEALKTDKIDVDEAIARFEELFKRDQP